MVVSKGVNRVEEFWFEEETAQDEINQDLEIGSHPLRIVVIRMPPPPPPPRAPTRELNASFGSINTNVYTLLREGHDCVYFLTLFLCRR